MDLGDTLAGSALQVICPQCGHADVDDLELLAIDEVHALTCEACARRFHLALFECAHCGEETVFVRASVPTPAEIRSASCRHCGHPLHDDGQDVRPLGRA
jgi:transcription elongation factor Elf1